MLKRYICFILMVVLLLLPACEREGVGSAESSVSETGDIERVKVTTDQVDIRSGCSTDANVLQTSQKDATLKVVNKVDDWYAIKLDDNSIGFIPENQATPIVVEDDPSVEDEPTPQATPQPTTTGPNNDQKTPSAEDQAENNASSATEEENQMLELINKERSSQGLEPLQMDMELTNIARIKSQDMIDNNYFSHNSPTYGSPFDMLKNFGVKYVKAGENIAGNQSVDNAHTSLMNSPGHRENIMSPDYTHIGIGIKDGGQYGKMFTQTFVSKPQ